MWVCLYSFVTFSIINTQHFFQLLIITKFFNMTFLIDVIKTTPVSQNSNLSRRAKNCILPISHHLSFCSDPLRLFSSRRLPLVARWTAKTLKAKFHFAIADDLVFYLLLYILLCSSVSHKMRHKRAAVVLGSSVTILLFFEIHHARSSRFPAIPYGSPPFGAKKKISIIIK